MENIISSILHPILLGWLPILKIIFIIISLVFLFFIIFALLKTSWAKKFFLISWIEFFTYRPFGMRKVTKKWREIIARLETGMESEAKLAVIEADSLLDDVLGKIGYRGETLGEKLKSITPDVIPNIVEVLEAHKIRNNIVHDPDYRLSLDQARRTLEIYEKALRELDVF
jgi:hypothetical protein